MFHKCNPTVFKVKHVSAYLIHTPCQRLSHCENMDNDDHFGSFQTYLHMSYRIQTVRDSLYRWIDITIAAYKINKEII